ncbi:MAG: DUF2017 family protein [Acidimicrobiales bacterium]
MRLGPRVRPTRDGRYEVRLPDAERQLLGSLASQMRAALDEGEPEDPGLRRLFPSAYPEDPARDAEYRGLVRDDLLGRRRAALDTLEATLGATRLDDDELAAWMGAINDLRLVLGTRLDVSEETDLSPRPDDPSAPALAVYGYLGVLLESIVTALGR